MVQSVCGLLRKALSHLCLTDCPSFSPCPPAFNKRHLSSRVSKLLLLHASLMLWLSSCVGGDREQWLKSASCWLQEGPGCVHVGFWHTQESTPHSWWRWSGGRAEASQAQGRWPSSSPLCLPIPHYQWVLLWGQQTVAHCQLLFYE